MRIPRGAPRLPAGERDADQEAAVAQRDAATQGALNAFVSSSDQTYEQFLRGFSQLTAADVAPSVIQGAFGGSDSPPLFMAPPSRPRLPSPPLAPPPSTTEANTTGGTAGDLEELEEEVLDVVGDHTSNMTSPVNPPQRVLQLDNFVDDEGTNSSDDEDLNIESVGSGYLASFSAADSPSEQCRPLSSSLSTSSTQSTTNKVRSINILNDLKSSAGSLIQPSPGTSDTEEELVYDPSLDRPNPGEVDDDDEGDAESRAASAALVTNIREMAYSARPAVEGETASCQHTNVETFEVSGTESEVELDEVQPFSLDDDFDYDNVVLTPKFTAAEQRELDEWARQGKEEQAREEAETADVSRMLDDTM